MSEAGSSGLDGRRGLQLVLAGLWLLDAVLQYQPFMFTRAFGQLLAGSAQGNAPVLARPITWNAGLVEAHSAALNTIFATIQLLLGLGIAIRPAVRPALAASIAWSLGVWWLGEGFGGVLAGTPSPLTGAPGPAVIYALLAVLLWPAAQAAEPPGRVAGRRAGAGRDGPSFAAAPAVGPGVARALWAVLWLSLAYFAVAPVNRSPQALSATIAAMGDGEPGWLAAIERDAAGAVSGQGLAGSVALAVALAVIAAGVYLPRPACRAVLVLAVAVSLAIWVFGQAFGMIMAGGATDPNSGPLLVLLAAAYWPRAQAEPAGARTAAARTAPARATAAGGVPAGDGAAA